jgi:hypothetical protein
LDTSELAKWIFRDAATAPHLDDACASARAAIEQWMCPEQRRWRRRFAGGIDRFFIYKLGGLVSVSVKEWREIESIPNRQKLPLDKRAERKYGNCTEGINSGQAKIACGEVGAHIGETVRRRSKSRAGESRHTRAVRRPALFILNAFLHKRFHRLDIGRDQWLTAALDDTYY